LTFDIKLVKLSSLATEATLTYKLMCLFNEGQVDDFTGAVRLGHPVPGDDWTLFCTGWLVLNAISDTALVDSLTDYYNHSIQKF